MTNDQITTTVNTMLYVNLALIQFDAIIDYNALPYAIVLRAKPDTDMSRVHKIGKGAVAGLVGVYTLVALCCHSYCTPAAAIMFSLYLVFDATMAVMVTLKGHKQALQTPMKKKL